MGEIQLVRIETAEIVSILSTAIPVFEIINTGQYRNTGLRPLTSTPSSYRRTYLQGSGSFWEVRS